MKADYDYRVLQPDIVTDTNGNQSLFTFSPLGLLDSSFARGKLATEGDQARPSVRMEFGFLAFENSLPGNPQPIFVRTIRSIHHDTELDVPLPERDETITTVEYSDGFGRLLQTRTQGEEVRFGDEHFGGGESVLPARQSDGGGGDVIGHINTDTQNPNVVVSGWQIYDNKGHVVEKFEPFFSEGWDYGQPEDSEMGQKVAVFYDPRGHVFRTLNPDGSEQRVIFGVPGTIAVPDLSNPANFEPTPWEAYTYDANDNAGRTHPAQAAEYQHHWNTPASILIDPLGRTIKAVERNRSALADPVRDLVTQTSYDIRGNAINITDALRRLAFTNVYDLANRPLKVKSTDAGQRISVLDAGGGVIEQRDSKGALSLHSYDSLNRSIRLWALDGIGQKLTLRERLEYGDEGDPKQTAANRAMNAAANRLGKLFSQFDEAGLLSFDFYDFKGRLLEKTRRVVSDAAILSVFSPPPAGWEVVAFRVDWTTPAATPLDTQRFTSSMSYDALGRAKLMTYPQDVETKRRGVRPHYNRSGALDRVELEQVAPGGAIVSDTFVERIAYNATGQRVLIAYGNGIMTRHAYNPQTFRLLRIRTEGYTKLSTFTYHGSRDSLQELAYDFDVIGNIETIRERTPGSGIMNTVLGQDALDRTFAYDALYRLLSADGRECDAPPPTLPSSPWDDAPRCTDLTKARRYQEVYKYDDAGNILKLNHTHFGNAGAPQSVNRNFTVEAATNRLQVVAFGSKVFNYTYDANGNMTGEGTSRHFEWDCADRMRVYRTQTTGSEPSLHAHYLYDAGGQRVKKVVRKQGGKVEVTVYIDGAFEYQRSSSASLVEENNTLHTMDNKIRVAQVRVGKPFASDTTPAVKYHFGDHLGTSNTVTDGSGILINREEYSPYGETTFGSYTRKRYRFTGKERDEESGLNYHGARYYASWLLRWSNCDPGGTIDGPNLYLYVADNPINLRDMSGLQGSSGDLPSTVPDQGDKGIQGSAGDVPSPPTAPPATANDPKAQGSAGDVPSKPNTTPPPDISTEHAKKEPSEFGESGVRLKAEKPREHYNNIVARNDAARGLLKRAEIAEAGHGCFYCHDIHFQTAADAERNLDLAHYDAVAVTLTEFNTQLVATILTEGAVSVFSSSRSVWNVEAYGKALIARDEAIHAFRLFPKKDIEPVATVIAGYNRLTGEVAVGTKWFGAGRFCAEDVAVSKLGGNAADVVLTPAVRPLNLREISVCPNCQLKFPASNFGQGTVFAPTTK